jgi:hypothetical protein
MTILTKLSEAQSQVLDFTKSPRLVFSSSPLGPAAKSSRTDTKVPLIEENKS